MKRKAQFNRIFIIQSLEEGLTGKRLYDDLKTLTFARDHVVRVELHDVFTKHELLLLLDSIPQRMDSEDLLPILHFEVHGSSNHDGIILSSRELVSWAELKTPLITINKASQFNLIVCFAACHGASFIKTLMPNDRSPCWAMIGPKKEIDCKSLLDDFNSMYQCILNGGTGDEAVMILNRSLPPKHAPYVYTTAESFFDLIWKAYQETSCTPEALKKRANSRLRELRRTRNSDRRKLHSRNEVIKNMREVIDPEIKHKAISLFFMADLFPQNWERFHLSDKLRPLPKR